MKGEKIRKSVKVWPCSPFGTLLDIPFLYLGVLRLSEGIRKRTATHESCNKKTVWFDDGFNYNDDGGISRRGRTCRTLIRCY